MNTLHFRYAVEIEKTHSITQAAENLYMAQPNLSKAIKELEASLEITIFRRTSKGVIPTEQGVKFLSYAKQILMQIDNMKAIAMPEKSEKHRIRISVPRTGYISKAFSDYLKNCDSSDDMEIYFYETNSMRTIENVRENGYNLGIIRFNARHEKYFMDYLDEKNLESQLVLEYQAIALMSAEYKGVMKENLTYAELSANCTELVQGDDSVPYVSGASEKLFADNRSADIKTRRICMFDRGSAYDFLLTVPNSFMLDSPVPESICKKYSLVQKKCRFNDNCFKDLLIYSADRKLSESELSLINKLYEVRNETTFKSRI
ncbi:MAG: LysR family transcriptional regulator [Ruminococcus sp.]|nr:LysR family transcriptional regulator [Ruminococcus sp.]MDE7105167.1 LysR family transcriptional regulator [Ruminococcus sp.]